MLLSIELIVMSQPPLQILYQDEWLVAIDKPAGYLVHPARDPHEDDLVAMKILRDQIGQRVHTIHRIDRPTSGVLLFGLEKKAAQKMHQALAQHDFEKRYWAIVPGQVPGSNWECHEPIQADETSPVREAHTSFCLLRSRQCGPLGGIAQTDGVPVCDKLHLVEATPHSGRFHQIRRHLLHQGIPIVGDYRYAGIERCEHLGALLGTGSRMLLQARSLRMVHPVTEKVLTITAQVDKAFIQCFPELQELEP